MTGTVDIDIRRGMLIGDVCLAGVRTQDTTFFVLHKGLNVKYVRSGSGRPLNYSGHNDLQPEGVALRYAVSDSLERNALCVSYVGAFPVCGDSLQSFDYQELIAFRPAGIRAAASTRWYPALYDPKASRVEEEVPYHLSIRCEECSVMYGAAKRFKRRVDRISSYYEEFLGIPFPDTLSFLRVFQVRPARVGSLWGFFSFPTLAMNQDFAMFAEGASSRAAEIPPEAADRIREALWGVIAHELAHYYFGTYFKPAGPYQQFFLESTAAYLALKATRKLTGSAAYRAELRRLRAIVESGSPLVSLDEVSTERPFRDDRHRYAYGPLLLVGLERQIGERRMRRLLRSLLNYDNSADIDYPVFEALARSAGISSEEWTRFETQCVRATKMNRCAGGGP